MVHPDVSQRVAAAPDAQRLWEREAEQQAIASLLDLARRGHGGALVMQGHPGLGKTRLLDLAEANGRGFMVLRASGRESTQGYPYAMVREAIGTLLDGRLRSLRKLAESQPALAPFVYGRPLGSIKRGEPVPAEVAEALSWLLAAAAERSPLLLLLDDLHWCDPDSLEFWKSMVIGARDLSMAVLLTLRPWDGPALRATDRLGQTGAARIVPLQPLTEASIRAVLAASLGTVPNATFRRQASTLTGGNPLLVQELARLVQAGASIAAVDTGRDLLRLRLAGLPATSLELLRAASVLGVEFDAGLAADVARIAEPELALQPLINMGLVSASRPPSRFVFHHPLLRQVAYDGLDAGRRPALHRRAAQALRSRGAPASMIVSHLLASRATDAHALDILREAAAEAAAAGGPETAARHLQTAVGLACSGAQRAEILLELGRVELRAGMGTSADHFRQAAATEGCPLRARVVALRSLGLALTLEGATERAREVFAGGTRDALAAGADDLAAECLVAQTILEMTSASMPAALVCAQRARELAQRAGRPDVQAKALAVWANVAFQMGDPRAMDVARHAMRLVALDPPDDIEVFWGWSVPTAFGMIAMRSEHYQEADEVFTAMADGADRRGTRPVSVWAAAFRAELAWRRGRLREALRLVEDAACFPAGIAWATAHALAMRGRILVDTGHIAEAEASLDRMEAEATGLGPALLWARFGRAALAAHHGRHDLAADLLLAGIARAASLGIRDPGSLPWHLEAAQACARSGRREEAQRLIAHTQSQAQTFGRRGLHAAALRQSACLAGRTDPAAARHLFCQALESLCGLDLPLEHGRALLDYGTLLRQTGHLPQARQVLGEAVEILSACGAEPWARMAETERRSAGGRSRQRRRPSPLTPQEDRIAQLVAEGHTNRQIAAQLWISPKTLETHLRHTYEKLGLSSRAELRGWVAARAGP